MNHTRRTAVGAVALAAGTLIWALLAQSPDPPFDPLFELTKTEITLPNGDIKLAISFYSASNHNYVVEFRDDLGEDQCADWRPLPEAPHNFGILFTTNAGPHRFFRLRRIDQPQGKLFALLANDTGTNSADAVTSDPTITGLAIQVDVPTSVLVSLDDPDGPSLTVTNVTRPRYFLVRPGDLDALAGGRLPDGPHTTYLRLVDDSGNNHASFAVPFELDSTPPTLQLELDPASDSDPAGDNKTTIETVSLIGTTQPGQVVDVDILAAPVVADQSGQFRIENVRLATGLNHIVLSARDAACNQANLDKVIELIAVPPDCPFDAALTGWEISASPVPTGVAAAGPGRVYAQDCEMILEEGDSLVVSAARSFTVPSVPSVLEISFAAPAFDQTATDRIRDAFEITTIRSLVPQHQLVA